MRKRRFRTRKRRERQTPRLGGRRHESLLTLLWPSSAQTFQAYPQFNVIPRKLIVAKRLSQCLNPALPSGVHQRALDAYAHILGVIGPDGLRRDLQIWSPGLLPFFQAASTSVKPTLLSIYEKHYLPLAEDLRPVMRALLLALLPGLEEETGEFFERVMKLLERAAGGVGRSFFLQNIWLVLIGTPGVRLAALNYLSRRMPRLNDEPDPAHVVGQDLGLMARGFAHALDDENLLVRRATLELLVSNLRMDSKTFQKAMKEPDRVLLVGAALGVVLRRDLSLNRRLYTWLLGPGETAEAQQFHLDTHGLALVHAALQRDFYGNEQSDSAERQRPYKIFISLLDKWEIGQPLTAVLVLDAFDALTKQVTGAPDDELATTANMLFEIVDPFVTYRQFFLALNAHFRSESSASNGSTEQPESAVVVEEKRRTPPVELLRSVLSLFRVHDDESRQIHLPLLFSVLLELADSVVAAQGCQAWSDELLSTLELANEILALIPPRVYARAHEATATADNDNAEEQPDESFLKRAQFSYEPRDASAEQAGRRFVGFNDARTLAKLVALSARLTQSGSGPAAEERRGSQTLILCCALRIFGAFFEKLDEAEGVLASAPVTGLDMRQQQALELEQSGLPKVEWDARNWVEEVLGRLRKVSAKPSCTFAYALGLMIMFSIAPMNRLRHSSRLCTLLRHL